MFKPTRNEFWEFALHHRRWRDRQLAIENFKHLVKRLLDHNGIYDLRSVNAVLSNAPAIVRDKQECQYYSALIFEWRVRVDSPSTTRIVKINDCRNDLLLPGIVRHYTHGELVLIRVDSNGITIKTETGHKILIPHYRIHGDPARDGDGSVYHIAYNLIRQLTDGDISVPHVDGLVGLISVMVAERDNPPKWGNGWGIKFYKPGDVVPD